MDAFVNLTAPRRPGFYQGFFRLCHGSQDIEFGEKVFVSLTSESKIEDSQAQPNPIEAKISDELQPSSLIDLQYKPDQYPELNLDNKEKDNLELMDELRKNDMFNDAQQKMDMPQNIIENVQEKVKEEKPKESNPVEENEVDPWKQLEQSMMIGQGNSDNKKGPANG